MIMQGAEGLADRPTGSMYVVSDDADAAHQGVRITKQASKRAHKPDFAVGLLERLSRWGLLEGWDRE